MLNPSRRARRPEPGHGGAPRDRLGQFGDLRAGDEVIAGRGELGEDDQVGPDVAQRPLDVIEIGGHLAEERLKLEKADAHGGSLSRFWCKISGPGARSFYTQESSALQKRPPRLPLILLLLAGLAGFPAGKSRADAPPGGAADSSGVLAPAGVAAAADSGNWIPAGLSDQAREALGIVITPWVKLPSQTLQDGRIRLALFDFGPMGQPTPDALTVAANYRRPPFGWTGGMLRQRTRQAKPGPYLCDFLEGEDASFVVAVDPPQGEYRMTLTLGDPDQPRGPIDVIVNGVTVAAGVTTAPGRAVEIGFEVVPDHGAVSFRLAARDCKSFAVDGAALYGPKGAKLGELFPRTDPRAAVPRPDSLGTLGRNGARRTLRDYCDFLLEHRPSEGCFSYMGAWYQNAYPVRTLLAGAVLLREPRYREAAFECLDRFVREQQPNGGWSSAYFGKAGCEFAVVPDTLSANLADIGTMSLCLALAAEQAEGSRRAAYLHAITTYADSLVLPNQLDDGAFPNLRYEGRDFRHPYSVATATQAASLSALYAVTKDPRYLYAAERAGEWLANTFYPDGQVGFFAHDQNQQTMAVSTAFGDLFYMVEALTWVAHYSRTPDTRALIVRALDRYVWASQGIAAATTQGYWWQPQSLWGSAKMGGMLYVLAQYREMGCRDARLRTWIPRALAWLGDEDLSYRIGVLADPLSMTGDFSMVATGFAGIGVAATIQPNALLPAPRDLRRPEAPPQTGQGR